MPKGVPSIGVGTAVGASLLIGVIIHVIAGRLDLSARVQAQLAGLDWVGFEQLPFSLLAVVLGTATFAAWRQVQWAREKAARRSVERAAERLTNLDPLTGLVNRARFGDRLGQTVAEAGAIDHRLALVLVDLDHFRDVNDVLGHERGDRLLIEVAGRLRRCVRDGDTVARLGGDEFAVMLAAIGCREDADRVAARIVGRLRQPFAIDGEEVHLAATAGLALHPDDGDAPATLLEHAELALYRAKELGRGGYRAFDVGMKARIQTRVRIERELRRALAEGQLELHYQPVIDLATWRVTAVEALVRWRHPEHGLLGPDRFLRVAESSGLIVPLSQWVIRTACAQLGAWRATGASRIRLAVNLAAAQCADPDLIPTIDQALAASGLAPADLELEITENVVIERTGADVLATLARLHARGVGLAFDDFGTGYSSLAHLRQVPVARVKIDRSFVRDMLDDRDDAVIVRAVIRLGRSLGLAVVAEGIELAEQLELLLGEGCQEGQGYLFAPPRPATELAPLLRTGIVPAPLRLVS